ncbi:MAG: site-specific integrase [Lachnospiraceae bacterium]|nr:site-specific integrase [Lachnospiraceae bacterium]
MITVISERVYKNKSGKCWRGCLSYTVDNASSVLTKWFRGVSCIDVCRKMSDFISYGFSTALLYGKFIEDEYLPYKRNVIKLSSYSRLHSTYTYHCCQLSDYALPEIKASHCLSILRDMQQKGFSKSSLDKAYEFFNNSFNYAIQQGHIDRNPLFNVPKMFSLQPKKEISVYTDDDIEKLWHGCYTFNHLAKYRFSVLFLLLTGLRCGELLALNKTDFDLSERFVRVRYSFTYVYDVDNGEAVSMLDTPKTPSGYRIVPLNDTAYDIACMLFDLYPHTPFFIASGAGTRVLPRNYSRMLQRLCEDCGVEYKGIHATRHSFATKLIRSGVPVKTVAELLGHANVQTTLNMYVHPDLSDLRAALNWLKL